MTFPVDITKFRGIPINSHPGAFGCARKYNFHEGVDLYGSPGDIVYSISGGEVISNLPFTGPSEGHPWWLPTNAVLVRNFIDDGYFVYGELASSLTPGTIVNSGDQIGTLLPVLPPEKYRQDIPGHSVTMLHLERWNSCYDISTGWSSWNSRESRPKYLQDPTPILINILFSSYQPTPLTNAFLTL